MGTSRDKGRVFVTVGTTLFDALVKEVDSQECKQVLASHGYSSLLIQLGRGSFFAYQGNTHQTVFTHQIGNHNWSP
jgi:beta-1,4-N-acetylglucosaminyltransferase